jgi:endo-1,4-beta-xylanase
MPLPASRYVALLSLFTLSFGFAAAQTAPQPTPKAKAPPAPPSFPAHAAGKLVVPLWASGAPGSEARKAEPEHVDGDKVSNIHHPSLTVYLPPKGKANGTAVIVIPGGGHRFLVMNHEGYNVAEWLAQRGITAFILKHRLGRDVSAADGQFTYQWDVHGLADGQRALRLVRHRAAEWGIDPTKVGMLGFSAGGEIAFQTAMRAAAGDAGAADPIDRESARPDFQALIYPGKSSLIKPEKGAPPVFLAAGFNDRPDISEGLANVYLLFKKAGVPAELHLYAGAGHGFGLRESNKSPAGQWPQRFVEWLSDQKLMR